MSHSVVVDDDDDDGDDGDDDDDENGDDDNNDAYLKCKSYRQSTLVGSGTLRNEEPVFCICSCALS